MEKYTPHKNYFEESNKYRKVYCISCWVGFIASFIAICINKGFFVDYISAFAIIWLNVICFIEERYRYKADQIRRADYMDNSFGTKWNHKSSKGYYDNDEVEKGMKKGVINLFENSFFTSKVSEAMFKKKLIPALLMSILILLAIYGLMINEILFSIFQLYLSKIFITDFIKIFDLKERSEDCFDELKNIADVIDRNKALTVSEKSFIKVLVDYEVAIAESKMPLDTNLFNQMNPQLTVEWEEIKIRYENIV